MSFFLSCLLAIGPAFASHSSELGDLLREKAYEKRASLEPEEARALLEEYPEAALDVGSLVELTKIPGADTLAKLPFLDAVILRHPPLGAFRGRLDTHSWEGKLYYLYRLWQAPKPLAKVEFSNFLRKLEGRDQLPARVHLAQLVLDYPLWRAAQARIKFRLLPATSHYDVGVGVRHHERKPWAEEQVRQWQSALRILQKRAMPGMDPDDFMEMLKRLLFEAPDTLDVCEETLTLKTPAATLKRPWN